MAGLEPTPELAAQYGEEFHRLLDDLAAPTLRAVALWQLEGSTNRVIAGKLDCVEQTLERKLRAIRRIWFEEDSP